MGTVIAFLKETREELGKVVWPSRDQTIKLTLMVIIVTVIAGLFIGALDYILSQLSAWIVNS